MAKNGAGYDPDIEDVPFGFDSDESPAEGNTDICDGCGRPIFDDNRDEESGLCLKCAHS